MSLSSSSQSRARVNFSLRETDLLTELVSKYSTILECIKTDQLTNNEKMECWAKLAREFNSQNGDQRYHSADCSRNKFKNMKNVARKKYADESAYISGTGSGRAKNFNTIDADERIQELMGISLTGIESDSALLDEDFDCSERNIDFHGIDEEEIILRLEDAVDVYVGEPKPSISTAGISTTTSTTSKKGCYSFKTPLLWQPKSAAFQKNRSNIPTVNEDQD